MPIYEYRCPECGHDFDKLQKVSDPPPACPKCSHPEVVKKVSQTSFHLKGTGWYVTDYKDRPSTATSKDAESSDSGSSDGGDSGESTASSDSTSSDGGSESGSSSTGTDDA
jgi:putative FmdB family regulatory protein